MTNSNIKPIDHINAVTAMASLTKEKKHLTVQDKKSANDQHQNSSKKQPQPENTEQQPDQQNIFKSDSEHIDFKA